MSPHKRNSKLKKKPQRVSPSPQEETHSVPTKSPSFLLNLRFQVFIFLLTVVYTLLVLSKLVFFEELGRKTLYLGVVELGIIVLISAESVAKALVFKVLPSKKFLNALNLSDCVFCVALCAIELSHTDIYEDTYYRISVVLKLPRILLPLIYFYETKTKNTLDADLESEKKKITKVLSSAMSKDCIRKDQGLKKDLQWCINSISNNKATNLNLDLVWSEYDNEDVLASILRTRNDIEVHEDSLFKPYESTQVNNLLKNIQSTSFDVFELKTLTGNNELITAVMFIFEELNLLSKMNLNKSNFENWVSAIQSGYKVDISYHNKTHATDVLQFYHLILHQFGGFEVCGLNTVELSSCYISAMVHDYEHPGVNNNFLVNSSDPLAILYNDKSVLENHHVSAAFQKAGSAFEGMSSNSYKYLRSLVVSMVLATDPVNHNSYMSHFKNKFAEEPFVESHEEKLLMLEVMMHFSDISNPCRPWNLCYAWTNLLFVEFFEQGDKERTMGLPISTLCDRQSVEISSSQVGFIDFVIEPTLVTLSSVLPKLLDNLQYDLEFNRKKWGEIASKLSQ